MDTILYFYQTNHTTEPLMPVVREFSKKDYLLVRIGLSPEAVLLLEEEDSYRNQQENSERKREKGILRYFQWLIRFFAGKDEEAEKKEKILQDRQILLKNIQRFWGDELTTFCICRSPITYFQSWRFSEFRETMWVERLLYGWDLPHFLVLGYSTNLRELLFLFARRMKSLKICVSGHKYEEELERLADDLFDEFGLTVTVRYLDEGEKFRNAGKLMSVSCNVLDFSGETTINIHMVPKGSVWYDVDAIEEKRYFLTERECGILYKSLTVP